MDAMFERLERLEIASQEEFMYFVAVSNRILDPAQPILILGETPLRRLAIPLAALRGSSDGIWATSIARHQYTAQTLDDAIVSCHRRCLLNMGLFYTNNMQWEFVDFDNKYADLRRVLRTPKSEDIIRRFSATADPTNLPQFIAEYGALRPPTSTIWFQHTWSTHNNNNNNNRRSSAHNTGDRRFLSRCVFSAARVQRPGDILLVGIESSRRMPRYDLEEALEELMHTTRHAGYRFLGEDTRLKRALMNYGHQPNATAREDGSVNDHMEDWVLGSSITHVFVRERGMAQTVLPFGRSQTDKSTTENDEDDTEDEDDHDEQYAIDTPKAVRPDFSHHRHSSSNTDSLAESDDAEITTSTHSSSSSSSETATSRSDTVTLTAPRDWTWTWSEYWFDLQPNNPHELPFDDESDDDGDDDDDEDDNGDNGAGTRARAIHSDPQNIRGRTNASVAVPPGTERRTTDLGPYDTLYSEESDVGGYDDDVLAGYWDE